jgi:Glycosyl transferase family 2
MSSKNFDGGRNGFSISRAGSDPGTSHQADVTGDEAEYGGGLSFSYDGKVEDAREIVASLLSPTSKPLSGRGDRPPAALGTHRVSVVIPTLNEAQNLPHVLPSIPTWVYEAVIVDGHSTDDTVRIAKTLLPMALIVLEDGPGKGSALAAGFAAAHGDIIVMLDADGSTDPGEIPRFVQALLDGADFAKGSRYVNEGGSEDISWLRAAGNKLLTWLVNLLYRTHYTDLCYGYNAFWSSCLPYMHLDCAGFEVETQMHTRAARAGLRVSEVPSMERKRLTGGSNLKPFRDGWRILRMILRERFAPRHVVRAGAGPTPAEAGSLPPGHQPERRTRTPARSAHARRRRR